MVRQEIGYREKGGQHTKFGNWYADRVQDSQYRNAPWCDMFIAWAADKAGVTDYVGQFAWTPSHAAWFIQKGAWTAKPEPGALVFFDWKGGKSYKGIDHVGIVERVSGNRIHTIEANVDRVWLKRKTRETDKVVGYGLPRVVKERLTQSEIRATDQPFVPVPRVAAPQGSPFDILGTPQALLAVMVLTTVVLSLRRAGHRRGTRRVAHRRFRWPWNAPDTPDVPPARRPTPARPAAPFPTARPAAPFPSAGRGEPAGPSPSAAPVRHPDPALSGRPESGRSRVPAGVGHGGERRPTVTRRRPYEPKG